MENRPSTLILGILATILGIAVFKEFDIYKPEI